MKASENLVPNSAKDDARNNARACPLRRQVRYSDFQVIEITDTYLCQTRVLSMNVALSCGKSLLLSSLTLSVQHDHIITWNVVSLYDTQKKGGSDGKSSAEGSFAGHGSGVDLH